MAHKRRTAKPAKRSVVSGKSERLLGFNPNDTRTISQKFSQRKRRALKTFSRFGLRRGSIVTNFRIQRDLKKLNKFIDADGKQVKNLLNIANPRDLKSRGVLKKIARAQQRLNRLNQRSKLARRLLERRFVQAAIVGSVIAAIRSSAPPKRSKIKRGCGRPTGSKQRLRVTVRRRLA